MENPFNKEFLSIREDKEIPPDEETLDQSVDVIELPVTQEDLEKVSAYREKLNKIGEDPNNSALLLEIYQEMQETGLSLLKKFKRGELVTSFLFHFLIGSTVDSNNKREIKRFDLPKNEISKEIDRIIDRVA